MFSELRIKTRQNQYSLYLILRIFRLHKTKQKHWLRKWFLLAQKENILLTISQVLSVRACSGNTIIWTNNYLYQFRCRLFFFTHNPPVVQCPGGLELSVIPGHNEDGQLYMKRLPFYSGKNVCREATEDSGRHSGYGRHTHIHIHTSPV